jgi:hypothetical protein
MQFNTLIKTVIKFAPIVFKLVQNEKVHQALKLGWHLYANRNQTRATKTIPRKTIRR